MALCVFIIVVYFDDVSIDESIQSSSPEDLLKYFFIYEKLNFTASAPELCANVSS